MTLSLSLSVRPSVRLFVRSSVTNELFLSSNSFNGISREFKGCLKLKGCLSKFQGCFKKVIRVFTESFNGVSRKVQGCFTEVSRVFTEVSRVFHGSFREVLRVFQEYFKDVSEKIEGHFKAIFKGVSWVFERS